MSLDTIYSELLPSGRIHLECETTRRSAFGRRCAFAKLCVMPVFILHPQNTRALAAREDCKAAPPPTCFSYKVQCNGLDVRQLSPHHRASQVHCEKCSRSELSWLSPRRRFRRLWPTAVSSRTPTPATGTKDGQSFPNISRTIFVH